jgi:hypothetical protein
MRDTTEAALERYYELLSARPPLARITTAVELSTTVRSLAESAIRAADPGASALVIRARLASRDRVARSYVHFGRDPAG